MTMHFGTLAAGMWSLERGTNVTDTGAPFHNVHECADGKYVSIAPVELRFFRELLKQGHRQRQRSAGPVAPETGAIRPPRCRRSR